MLTKDILFGMNILTLAGFVVMGLTLTLNRKGQTGKALSIGLMATGTRLVFFGLYAGGLVEIRLPSGARGVLVVLVPHQNVGGADPACRWIGKGCRSTP